MFSKIFKVNQHLKLITLLFKSHNLIIGNNFCSSSRCDFNLIHIKIIVTKSILLVANLYVVLDISQSTCQSSNSSLINNICYQKSTNTATWFEARDNCLMNNDDLASSYDITSISSTSLGIGLYWIGLRRTSWTWQSQSNIHILNIVLSLCHCV